MSDRKYKPGKHFLQLPGPSNVPDRILNAMCYPTIDHRGPEFSELALKCLSGIKTIFKTKNPVIIFPASGTGAWEAALVNTLNDGDNVLMVETGHFASLWNNMAQKLGLKVELLKTDWRQGLDPNEIEKRNSLKLFSFDRLDPRPLLSLHFAANVVSISPQRHLFFQQLFSRRSSFPSNRSKFQSYVII